MTMLRESIDNLCFSLSTTIECHRAYAGIKANGISSMQYRQGRDGRSGLLVVSCTSRSSSRHGGDVEWDVHFESVCCNICLRKVALWTDLFINRKYKQKFLKIVVLLAIVKR